MPLKAFASSTILLFGDSIIAGYNLAEKDSLSTKLEGFFEAQGLNVYVVNGGVSGDTTASGLSRLEWSLNEHQPDLVLLALGGNDVLRGIAPAMTKKNVEAMLQILQENGTETILSEVQAPANMGFKYAREFNDIYEDLADDYDVPLYPFLLENIFGKTGYMQGDAIHPSAKGIDQITQELGPYLLKYVE